MAELPSILLGFARVDSFLSTRLLLVYPEIPELKARVHTLRKHDIILLQNLERWKVQNAACVNLRDGKVIDSLSAH
jgi:hypothetical protein